jgi:hypothetical protein
MPLLFPCPLSIVLPSVTARGKLFLKATGTGRGTGGLDFGKQDAVAASSVFIDDAAKDSGVVLVCPASGVLAAPAEAELEMMGGDKLEKSEGGEGTDNWHARARVSGEGFWLDCTNCARVCGGGASTGSSCVC